jgi:voltage-gated potassium channel
MELRKRLVIALTVFVCILVAGASGYRILTRAPWLDCVYMTTITLSTVGYGEVIRGLDQNPTARVFTMFLIFVGIGILTYVVSITTAFIVEGELTQILRRMKMEKRIAALQGHSIICGAGSIGKHIVEELHQTGRRFVVIERDESVIRSPSTTLEILYVIGDATMDETLKKAGITRATALMAVLPDDKDNLFITITARQLNPKILIVAKAVSQGCESKLVAAGANKVVDPQRIGALRIVSEVVRPAVVSFLDVMLRDRDEALRFEEVRVPTESKWIGKNVGDLDVYKKFSLSLVAVRHPGQTDFQYNPGPHTPLHEGTTLVVLGEAKKALKLQEMIR